jgi:hypothetical protein
LVRRFIRHRSLEAGLEVRHSCESSISAKLILVGLRKRYADSTAIHRKSRAYFSLYVVSSSVSICSRNFIQVYPYLIPAKGREGQNQQLQGGNVIELLVMQPDISYSKETKRR